MEHRNYRVYGKVQGVFFRKSTQQKAARLGVKGFVCNEEDGSVFLEAEGSTAALDELGAWLRQGPPQAEVERVEYTMGEPKGFHSFDVRR